MFLVNLKRIYDAIATKASTSALAAFFPLAGGNVTGAVSQARTLTDTSGASTPDVAITTTYNEPTGNATHTNVVINRVETHEPASDSRFFDFQVNGVSAAHMHHTGVMFAFQYVGNGGQLVGLNASNITTGTLSPVVIPSLSYVSFDGGTMNNYAALSFQGTGMLAGLGYIYADNIQPSGYNGTSVYIGDLDGNGVGTTLQVDADSGVFWFNQGDLNLGGGGLQNVSGLTLNTTTPAAPANGQIWFTGSAVKVRIGGVTKTFTVT